ncbi:MAG: DUF4190 domain-containing protein [Pseudomonadota bacterium]|nr:DUF4190 domain-containing protein [Pseudomonadota bacterium]
MTNWEKDRPNQQPAQYPAPPQGGNYPSAPPPGYGGYPEAPSSNGLAIAALVCGIIGLLFLWFILSPLAIIFGAIGLNRANKGASGKGMAVAGIVLGVIALIGYIVLIAVLASNHRFIV